MVLLLLEDRFHLAFHRGTLEGPIYALVAAKGGRKFKPATASADGADVPQASSMVMINGVRESALLHHEPSALRHSQAVNFPSWTYNRCRAATISTNLLP